MIIINNKLNNFNKLITVTPPIATSDPIGVRVPTPTASPPYLSTLPPP